MTSGFTRHRRSGRVIANFSAFEADLVRSLAAQLVELLRSEQALPDESADPLEAMFDFAGPRAVPEDPVLARLLPSAYPGDVESAAEFRRFTEGALRDGKVAAAQVVITTLEEAGLPPVGETSLEGLGAVLDVELELPTAMLWLKSLADMRLALGTRLGVEEGDEGRWDELPDEDPQRHTHDIYQWLGYLQESLVDALDR